MLHFEQVPVAAPVDEARLDQRLRDVLEQLAAGVGEAVGEARQRLLFRAAHREAGRREIRSVPVQGHLRIRRRSLQIRSGETQHQDVREIRAGQHTAAVLHQAVLRRARRLAADGDRERAAIRQRRTEEERQRPGEVDLLEAVVEQQLQHAACGQPQHLATDEATRGGATVLRRRVVDDDADRAGAREDAAVDAGDANAETLVRLQFAVSGNLDPHEGNTLAGSNRDAALDGDEIAPRRGAVTRVDERLEENGHRLVVLALELDADEGVADAGGRLEDAEVRIQPDTGPRRRAGAEIQGVHRAGIVPIEDAIAVGVGQPGQADPIQRHRQLDAVVEAVLVAVSDCSGERPVIRQRDGRARQQEEPRQVHALGVLVQPRLQPGEVQRLAAARQEGIPGLTVGLQERLLFVGEEATDIEAALELSSDVHIGARPGRGRVEPRSQPCGDGLQRTARGHVCRHGRIRHVEIRAGRRQVVQGRLDALDELGGHRPARMRKHQQRLQPGGTRLLTERALENAHDPGARGVEIDALVHREPAREEADEIAAPLGGCFPAACALDLAEQQRRDVGPPRQPALVDAPGFSVRRPDELRGSHDHAVARAEAHERQAPLCQAGVRGGPLQAGRDRRRVQAGRGDVFRSQLGRQCIGAPTHRGGRRHIQPGGRRVGQVGRQGAIDRHTLGFVKPARCREILVAQHALAEGLAVHGFLGLGHEQRLGISGVRAPQAFVEIRPAVAVGIERQPVLVHARVAGLDGHEVLVQATRPQPLVEAAPAIRVQRLPVVREGIEPKLDLHDIRHAVTVGVAPETVLVRRTEGVARCCARPWRAVDEQLGVDVVFAIPHQVDDAPKVVFVELGAGQVGSGKRGRLRRRAVDLPAEHGPAGANHGSAHFQSHRDGAVVGAVRRADQQAGSLGVKGARDRGRADVGQAQRRLPRRRRDRAARHGVDQRDLAVRQADPRRARR